MTTAPAEIRARIAQQKFLLPGMYGAIDFTRRPERFTDAPDAETAIRAELESLRPRLLADSDRVATIEAYTMLGDLAADAYAALMPEYGFRRLVEMLDQACADGIGSIEHPPAELIALLAEMERIPTWLDMALVEEGARIERNMTAHLMPFLIRGSFVGTFMNSYAALPMAITGSLGTRTAGRRMTETASFFACTTLPGALARHGVGFRAAAKVRLMHSMVRFNILRRDWDAAVYGIPIPQSDQMPAGLIPTMLLALRVLDRGRDHFTPAERAQVEFARYRCYLLGLPEDLLPATPREIVDVLATRQATLRRAYDDTTCGALVRATMAAYTEPDRGLASRLHDRVERSAAKVFFVQAVLSGSTERAAAMGIEVTAADKLRAAVAFGYAGCRLVIYRLLLRIPATRSIADARLVRKIDRYLARLGHAEFTTDASTYRAP
ncbi:oxygenase MpaB family protein [Nocardia sp. NPDC050718]|uniref:oxygenase MpaB family protein n=1 Tax=Nocardia sp. NPDC050718 TaxID=3155788 RepID=UPI0033F229B7